MQLGYVSAHLSHWNTESCWGPLRDPKQSKETIPNSKTWYFWRWFLWEYVFQYLSHLSWPWAIRICPSAIVQVQTEPHTTRKELKSKVYPKSPKRSNNGFSAYQVIIRVHLLLGNRHISHFWTPWAQRPKRTSTPYRWSYSRPGGTGTFFRMDTGTRNSSSSLSKVFLLKKPLEKMPCPFFMLFNHSEYHRISWNLINLGEAATFLPI